MLAEQKVVGSNPAQGTRGKKRMNKRDWKKITISQLKGMKKDLTLVVGRVTLNRSQAIHEVRRKTEVGEILVAATKHWMTSKERKTWIEKKA